MKLQTALPRSPSPRAMSPDEILTPDIISAILHGTAAPLSKPRGRKHRGLPLVVDVDPAAPVTKTGFVADLRGGRHALLLLPEGKAPGRRCGSIASPEAGRAAIDEMHEELEP